MRAQVEADPALKERVFTINGYYEDSKPGNDPFTFTTDDFGFMV
jgi:hypothetical protein